MRISSPHRRTPGPGSLRALLPLALLGIQLFWVPAHLAWSDHEVAGGPRDRAAARFAEPTRDHGDHEHDAHEHESHPSHPPHPHVDHEQDMLVQRGGPDLPELAPIGPSEPDLAAPATIWIRLHTLEGDPPRAGPRRTPATRGPPSA